MNKNNIWKSKEQKCRLLVDNTANQDTEKVSQTVSVASVERTALAAATEDHVWAESEFGPNGSKKARGTNRERNVSGKLISEILRADYLLFV